MMASFSSRTVLFVSACFMGKVAGTIVGSTIVAGGNTRVEPFVRDWCAAEFSEFPLNSRDNATITQVPLEPFVGQWCLKQYRSHDSLGDTPETNDLYYSHVDIRPYFQEWGTAELQGSTREQLETFLGGWCVVQFPHLLENVTALEMLEYQKHTVALDPFLGSFCQVTYAQQLPPDFSLDQINWDRNSLDSYFLTWVNADQNERKQEFTLLFATLVSAMGSTLVGMYVYLCCCSRHRSSNNEILFDDIASLEYEDDDDDDDKVRGIA